MELPEDAIAIRRAHGPEDLEDPKVTSIEINTQWHRIPAGAVKNEGVVAMAEQIGTTLTEVTNSCIAGNRVYKVKLLLPIEKPLKDTLVVTHPTLGSITAYIVYERVSRLCMFCGRLGHDNTTCADKNRMQRLMIDPKYKNRSDAKSLSENRVRPWINNQDLIPVPDMINQGIGNQNPQNTAPFEFHAASFGQTQNSAQGETRKKYKGIKITERREKGMASGLDLDLNQTEMGQTESRKRRDKGPAYTTEGAEGMLFLEGPSMGELTRQEIAQESGGNNTDRSVCEIVHVNKKRVVEVSQGPPPPQQ